MAIIFTEAALKQLTDAVEEGDYVRLGVKGGGCSGYSYLMEVEEGCDPKDVIHEFGNVKICMDRQSDFMLSETTVDYKSTLSQSGFTFENARATSTCGCGTSFSQDGVKSPPPGGCGTTCG